MSTKELIIKFKTNFSVTTLLIVINVILFLLIYFLTKFVGLKEALLLLGAEYVPYILNGQFWRIVLPSFLHANPLHLLLNMWALHHLGGAIETFYGSKKLITVYILCGIAGVIVSSSATLVNMYLNQGEANPPISVGASAAIFGFVGLLLGNRFKKDTYSVSIESYINTSQLWLFIGYNVLIGFGINFFGGPLAVNNFAHIGGFLGGLILGSTLDLINTTYQSRFKKVLENLLYYLSLILLVVALFGAGLYLFVAT